MVSTPDCRAARAASNARYDEADHLQTYFFAGLSAMDGFNALSVALRNAGRAPYLLPLVERSAYRLEGIAAAPRIKVGADVLLWWSTKGVYFMIERGGAPVADLLDVPGVGGARGGEVQSHSSLPSTPGITPAFKSATCSSTTNLSRWPNASALGSSSAGRRRALSHSWPPLSTASWPTSGIVTCLDPLVRAAASGVELEGRTFNDSKQKRCAGIGRESSCF